MRDGGVPSSRFAANGRLSGVWTFISRANSMPSVCRPMSFPGAKGRSLTPDGGFCSTCQTARLVHASY